MAFSKPEITAETEDRLWERAVFVWDTSAICSLYSLTPDAKDTFTEILGELKDRTWIPARVMTEYERHRNELLYQPIREHYKKPEFLSTHYLSKLDEFIRNSENNQYYHPQFEDKTVADLNSLREEAGKVLDKIRITTEEAIKKGKERAQNDAKKDIIYDAISELEQGTPFHFSEIVDIIKEGDMRYRHRIPPGYMDEEKESVDKFGDLIIWKEICRYGKESGRPVIFICNDIKEDWNAGNINAGDMVPREELIDEFRSATSQDIWFYTLNGFISGLKKRIEHEEVKKNNDNLTAILRELEIIDMPDDRIKVVCEHCGEVVGFDSDDFWWDWEFSSADERGMGEELCFTCEEHPCCPECGKEFRLSFEMYQYPVNVVNYVNLETEGCKVVSTPPLDKFISYNRYDTCVRCGEFSDSLNEEGFCQNCMDEFDYECNRED